MVPGPLLNAGEAQNPGNWWPLAFPAITLVAASVAAVVAFQKASFVNSWLSESFRNRLIAAVVGLVSTGTAGYLLRLPDFQGIQAGSVDVKDTAILCILTLTTVIPIWINAVVLRNTDTWNVKLKQAEKDLDTAQAEVVAAKAAEYFQYLVSHTFLGVVGVKRERAHSVLKERRRIDPPHFSLDDIRSAASPRKQMARLITIVWEIYRQQLNQVNQRANLRVAYFQAYDNRLVVRYGWDGFQTECISSPAKRSFRSKFSLNGSVPETLAVAVARAGDIVIVPDAAVADADPGHPFRFCNPGQAKKIKSLVVMAIGPADSVLSYHRHVICIDTNEPEFFDDRRRDQLDCVKLNLEQRLLCELEMEALLYPK